VGRECSCGWYKFPIIMPQNIVLTRSVQTLVHSCVFKLQTDSNIQVKLNMGNKKQRKKERKKERKKKRKNEYKNKKRGKIWTLLNQ
jgi:hypothetical protein